MGEEDRVAIAPDRAFVVTLDVLTEAVLSVLPRPAADARDYAEGLLLTIEQRQKDAAYERYRREDEADA